MSPSKFVGRRQELSRLQGLFEKRCGSLIVVRGRRRIGKSRLLAEFGKNIKSFFFSGQAPTPQTSARSQRNDFSQQLEKIGIRGIKDDNWGNLFWHLSKETVKGKTLIVLDEISWMGGKDPFFLGHLKTAWDLYFSKNPELVIALCGSVSSWIEKNILSSTGFLGRISLDLVVEELPLKVCSGFWHPKEALISPYEKFKYLAVSGGVPLYLEQLKPHLTAEKNIQELCFTRGGLLVKEFDRVFSDLFSRSKIQHKEIILSLAKGPKELTQISKELSKSLGGGLSKALEELIQASFIKRDFTWDLKTGKEKKFSRYRLSDNYMRFYLKYIAPNQSKIEKDIFSSSLTQLPSWESIMGLQFENLVVHNRKILWELLNIQLGEIVNEGPFFQRANTKQRGCQIDYLIQTRFQNLYICEVKFSKNPIGSQVIEEMEEKRKRLKIPKNCSVRPLLVHVNGVDERVIDERYFDKIIDFAELLN